MPVRDQGFALVLVLLAAAGVFTLSVQSAAMMRTATLETRVLKERGEAHREAQNAVVVVLRGLFAEESGAPGPDAAGTASGGGGQNEAEPEVEELPEIVRALLAAAGHDVEAEAREATSEDATVTSATEGGAVASRSARTRSVEVLKEIGLPAGSVDVRFDDDGPVYRVTLTDAVGQLNVNAAPPEQLAAYFRGIGIDTNRAMEMAHQIADWRDEDGQRRPFGAEQGWYQVEGVTCRDGEFASLDELLYLPSIDREMLDRMRGDLCLGGDGKLHIPTVSRNVLASVPGMTEGAVERILDLRSSGTMTMQELERALPARIRKPEELFRIEPTNILRVRVDVMGSGVRTYDGVAILSGRGIDSFGLRPL